MKSKIQVEKEHYNLNYDSKERFISYHNQIRLIVETKPKKILEIGVGNKTVYHYLTSLGINVIGCDINSKLKPDVIGDIRSLPFKDNSFDLVVAFEVLEHLPFEEFEKALNEMKRVSNNKVIISIPSPSAHIINVIKINLPFLKKKQIMFSIKIPPFFLNLKNNKEHYWEMGYNRYPKKLIKTKIKKYFKIIKESSDNLNPYHYFFVLKK